VSLPHVLLGLLSEQPRTGYELERSLREELDSIWKAEFSQIYPVLARLRRAGFVFLRVLGPRRGPRRHLYRITASGRRELRRWVAGQVPAPIADRDTRLARLAFLDTVDPVLQIEILQSEEQQVSREIERLQSAAVPGGFRREARRGIVARLETTRHWVRSLSRLVPRSSAGPGKKK
jgi:DNA-binding PadR family transcriptional regulator